ncbi:hypothetical protein ACFOOK_26300 [Micromonospora krabiensis]|uniref:Uncharacterized protein n=1 Tax=Micromonospora krabiensis TaxID=307121 RepID=A0A1C3N5S4_9ACTN|nr:hypothetical protein [Micromonospora krabiensis]SBV27921.1 hypothetical protein GA0070620_3452 [Micromonospora krabiensis]
MDALKRLLPLRAVLKVGPLHFEAALFDMDDETEDEMVSNTTTQIGFALPERVDEVNPSLDPLEDDDATPEDRRKRP